MGICSVVITTDEADAASGRTLMDLHTDPRWSLGDRQQGMVAAVLETDTVAEDRRCLRWLDEQPGVVAVHLVFAHYGNEGRCPSLPEPPDLASLTVPHDSDPSCAPAEQDET